VDSKGTGKGAAVRNNKVPQKQEFFDQHSNYQVFK